MRVTCRVKKSLSKSEQIASQKTLPQLSASAHVSAANTLTLLFKPSATVIV